MAEIDVLLSDYLGIDYNQFKDFGLFDAVINRDSAFFINILRLKQSKTPEFVGSYQRINNYFMEIAILLENAEEKSIEDKCFKTALNRFDFSEVNGINLGFSKSKRGSGFGEKIGMQVISDAFVIVKKGCKAPELFHMLQLFEDGVGPDRLSDMIATIILPDIEAYTRRVQKEFGINEKNYPNESFKNEILMNSYKNCPLYLLPEEILHKLPVAKSWEEIETVMSENNIIRQEINIEIGDVWSQWASSEKKNYLKNKIFMDLEVCNRVLDGYRNETLDELDLEFDSNYFFIKLWQRVKDGFSYDTMYEKKAEISSFNGAIEIVNIFKDWVENNKGWAEVLNAESHKQEKSVQRLLHLCAKNYLEINNLDMSCEANEGPGPVDFKISRGNDKTVVELKLSSNADYKHGYESQIERYAKAEKTKNMVFVFVNTGNPIRVKNLIKLHEQNINKGEKVPEVVIIDSTRQVSASQKETT